MGKEVSSADEKPAESKAAQIERQQQQQAELHKNAIVLGNVIEEVLFALTSKGFSIIEWRELCRNIGYKYHYINMFCNAEQWKLVRDVLVGSMSSGTKWVPWLFRFTYNSVLDGTAQKYTKLEPLICKKQCWKYSTMHYEKWNVGLCVET